MRDADGGNPNRQPVSSSVPAVPYLNQCTRRPLTQVTSIERVSNLPASGMCLMQLPMTYPSATGMMCVTPSPASITVPVRVRSATYGLGVGVVVFSIAIP